MSLLDQYDAWERTYERLQLECERRYREREARAEEEFELRQGRRPTKQDRKDTNESTR